MVVAKYYGMLLAGTLLAGTCKSGIEALVRALLQIPGVGPLLAAPIPSHNGIMWLPCMFIMHLFLVYSSVVTPGLPSANREAAEGQ